MITRYNNKQKKKINSDRNQYKSVDSVRNTEQSKN